MHIFITDWALQSYLDLKHKRVFSSEEFETVIRPDVERLQKGYPSADPKFENQKFWGPATDRNGKPIPNAYKMKWHQIGSGRVQLRLGIFIQDNEAFLCRGYVKKDEKVDRREMERLKIHIQDIREDNYEAWPL